MSRRSRVLTAGSAATIVLVALLAVHIYLASAGTTVHTVTAYGNAQIDTAQSKFGGASGLFDGAGDYLSTPDSEDWNFGSGDFTIDFWVRFNSLPGVGAQRCLYSQRLDDSNIVVLMLYNNAGTYELYFIVLSGGSGIGYATFDVLLNNPGSALSTTLYFEVVGPGGYRYFDSQQVSVRAGETGRFQFTWQIPSAIGVGQYQVLVSLIPPMPTAIAQTHVAIT